MLRAGGFVPNILAMFSKNIHEAEFTQNKNTISKISMVCLLESLYGNKNYKTYQMLLQTYFESHNCNG